MLHEIELSGEWDFALDPEGQGLRADWHTAAFEDSIALPGTIDLAEKTPAGPSAGMAYLTRRHPYVGPAWYARDFVVPDSQAGLHHDLMLERPHGEVRVWIDGLEIGRDLGLCTPNMFLLGQLEPGNHRIVLRVDNSDFPNVGQAIREKNPDVAHSTSEHTQSNWNGIVGAIRIEARAGRIARLDVTTGKTGIDLRIELDALDPSRTWPTFWTEGGHVDELHLTATLDDGRAVSQVLPLDIDSGYTPLDLTMPLPVDAARWDEFSPAIHRLKAEWRRDGAPVDFRETDFGLRHIEREGRHIRLNGRRIFLRGTLDCCIFPKTGHPPMDREGWRVAFGSVQEHGLNHVRFHSWCPPRAAFEVADELGLYLHVETPVWCALGSDPEIDAFTRREAERIVAEYGNHPSFVMLTVGNEVSGSGLHAWLERFLEEWCGRDPRRLYNGGSGWPSLKRADYLSKPEPRSHRWGEGLESRLNARSLETETDWSEWVQAEKVPLLGHEIGQWCVYPDLDSIPRYDGPLAPDAFDIVARDLESKGRRDSAYEKMMCSGALQTALYKEDIEASLRTPDYAGFQLLGLQDFPGQGTALVGVVDAFWSAKPYDDPVAFRRFCGPVVPLLLAPGFVLTKGAAFTAGAAVSLFTQHDLAAGEARWSVQDRDGGLRAEGTIAHDLLQTGDLHHLGDITVATDGLAQGRYTLTLFVGGADNSWDFWVFAEEKADLPIVTRLGAAELERLMAGESLVFAPAPETIVPNAELGFTTLFWNTVWTDGQPPQTLGLINRTEHPVFSTFPAERPSGWHEWELLHDRRALDLDGLGFGRIIDVIDDWNQNRDLALLAEAKVGAGRLIASAIDLTTPGRPVAAALSAAIARHLAAPETDAPELTPDAVSAWVKRMITGEAKP
ncbi:sugar-binding domain-containing protein [Martelella mangrovi]|uniref:Glycoside hydrolase family 2 n=1 Tax=Martelella mangrovi TaxID=1397477 RepID=A0ABV2I9Z2_9HYPH